MVSILFLRIDKLDNLTEDDLEDIRKKRMQEMKSRQLQMQQWKINVNNPLSQNIISLSVFRLLNKFFRVMESTQRLQKKKIFLK